MLRLACAEPAWPGACRVRTHEALCAHILQPFLSHTCSLLLTRSLGINLVVGLPPKFLLQDAFVVLDA